MLGNMSDCLHLRSCHGDVQISADYLIRCLASWFCLNCLNCLDCLLFPFCLHGLSESTQKSPLLWISLFLPFLSMLNLLINSYIVVWILVHLLLFEPRDIRLSITLSLLFSTSCSWLTFWSTQSSTYLRQNPHSEPNQKYLQLNEPIILILIQLEFDEPNLSLIWKMAQLNDSAPPASSSWKGKEPAHTELTEQNTLDEHEPVEPTLWVNWTKWCTSILIEGDENNQEQIEITYEEFLKECQERLEWLYEKTLQMHEWYNDELHVRENRLANAVSARQARAMEMA